MARKNGSGSAANLKFELATASTASEAYTRLAAAYDAGVEPSRLRVAVELVKLKMSAQYFDELKAKIAAIEAGRVAQLPAGRQVLDVTPGEDEPHCEPRAANVPE